MKNKFLVALLFVAIFAGQAFSFSNNVRWQSNFDNAITGGILISGNNLYFGDVTGTFYAVNKNSGSLIWSVSGSSGYEVEGYPAATSNGNIVFTQTDGSIVCVKASDGSTVWNYTPNENSFENISDGAVAGSGLIYMVKSDAKLYALNENSGSVAWTYKSSSQGLRTAPYYANGMVFLGEYDGIFSMIDAKSGKRLNGGGAGGAVNTPVVSNGIVYFSAWDGSVNAVQIKSVIPLWEAKVGDTITTPPVVGSGVIAVGTGRGHVIALNAKDGSILWNYGTEKEAGGISKNLLISNGIILAGTDDGQVFALDSKSGHVRSTVNSENGMTVDGAVSDGVFYFASGSTVYAVN